jgi:hypothetical protein
VHTKRFADTLGLLRGAYLAKYCNFDLCLCRRAGDTGGSLPELRINGLPRGERDPLSVGSIATLARSSRRSWPFNYAGVVMIY